MDLQPEGRLSYLLMSCDDGGFRQEVVEALQWEERMGSFLKELLFSLTSLLRPFQPNQLIADRFEIVRELGEGGMGFVYARPIENWESLAQSRLQNPVFNGYFYKLKAALKVRHHNICLIKEIHTAQTDIDEIDFLTMELLNGQTLAAYLATVGKMTPENT